MDVTKRVHPAWGLTLAALAWVAVLYAGFWVIGDPSGMRTEEGIVAKRRLALILLGFAGASATMSAWLGKRGLQHHRVAAIATLVLVGLLAAVVGSVFVVALRT